MRRQTADIDAALAAAGAVLVRRRKHRIYRLPNGRRLVVSVSPSDRRAGRNAVQRLRHLLRESPQ